MIGWVDIFFFFIIGAALLLSVLGLWFTAVIPGLDRWSKRFFLCYFVVLMLCGVSGLAGTVISYASGSGTILCFILILECLLIVLPMPMLTAFLLRCCAETRCRSRLLHTVSGLWAVYSILVISGAFTDAFFFITPDGQPVRGAWYPLMLLPVTAIDLLNLIGLMQRRKRLSRKVFLSLLMTMLPTALTVLVHMFVDIYLLVDICITLSSLSMYSLILSDQIEQDLTYQREIAHQRASIVVLQMRPHFIYNTMTSIYCLCKRDPEKARQVTMDFTTYLRKNFTAIASAAPIPFTSELEHTRAYLAVETAQYSKSLMVEYDTPHTFFRVPPLTLQPIVENAVKHGRDPDARPLCISIRTRKTDAGSEITVEDTGPGFDPSDEDKPHTTLTNIRQRLEMMCGGSMTITPRAGGGTVVTVVIPDSGHK